MTPVESAEDLAGVAYTVAVKADMSQAEAMATGNALMNAILGLFSNRKRSNIEEVIAWNREMEERCFRNGGISESDSIRQNTDDLLTPP